MTADQRVEHIHGPEARWDRPEPLRERRGANKERPSSPRRSQAPQTLSSAADTEEPEKDKRLDALA